MLRVINVLTFAVFIATVPACSLDSTELLDEGAWDDDMEHREVQEPPVALEVTAPEQVNADAVDDGAAQALNCSVVQYCNASGSIGTRCLQRGCSLEEALAECVTETRNICGSRTCIWEIVATDGYRWHEGGCIGESPGWWYRLN